MACGETVSGNPSDWVKHIETIAAAGATKLWVGIGDQGDFERPKHDLGWFGKRILPHFA